MPIKPQGARNTQTDDASNQSGFGGSDSWLTPGSNPTLLLNEVAAAIAAQARAASSTPAQPDATAVYGNFCSVGATVAVTVTVSTTLKSTVTTSAAVGATTTVKTTVPSWVSTLGNAAIKADMTSAIVNGTVTYAGLLKVFTDIDASLAATKTKLSASQFADLKTIAANLNNGVSTSSYLTYITQAFVNGNAANATWTGGAASSVALGNLASGSTELQFAELIGKWFLGTDLPSSKVILGSTQFSVSYANSTKALFSAAGPSMSDINQGYLGDCYLLAGLAEVAYKEQSVISSMFTANGNNTYGVRFYVNGTARYVTVNTSLANGGTIFNNGGNAIWASLAEKAYAELQASGVYTGNSINYGNSYTTIGNGGAPEIALEAITGATQITDYRAMGGSWGKVVYNSSFGVTGYTTGNSTSSVLATIAASLAAGDDVILSSYTNAKDATGKTTLVASHAMSIYGYNNTNGMLQIRNPWGSAAGQYWQTTFEVSLATLLAAGDTITIDNVGDAKKLASTTTTTSSGLKLTSDVNDLSGPASGFVQAIASLTDGGASSVAFTQSLASQQQTLAMPMAA
ncbi:C2 family cysteine protease [Bradyrhizobium sp. HKCCYLS20291]|uniref:C2 family cysteine protease n=1 Tax=Bradyrhizobium sp. HKCCYLS20291 TaxID=3420766 RepID=UPI003EB703F3